jgi:hypothetical protein
VYAKGLPEFSQTKAPSVVMSVAPNQRPAFSPVHVGLKITKKESFTKCKIMLEPNYTN